MKTVFSSILSLLLLMSACSDSHNKANRLTASEEAQGWKLLFDGKTLENWHAYNHGKQKSEWAVVDGTIFCDPASADRAGDLTSDAEYENYDLVFDWKLPENGNSGVFINVLEVDTLTAAWFTGPEYQLLDSAHKDYQLPLKRAGCLYGISPLKNAVDMKGSGQWNHSRIVQNNGLVKFFSMGYKQQKWILNPKNGAILLPIAGLK
ncbi:DUF1080 domain-containing protein [Niabella hibiscisoli]|nr:DUF1080 domain-containing protein [Niabella hibiscisoli]MCH5720765.1 DUF1080 domain-containing protein [Niabella hibiscisoli]